MRRIAVIGTGPAGVMAALTAAETRGVSVDCWDAAVPLATILRTGGGRCNITNAGQDVRAFAACYPRGGNFLLSLLSRFGSPETMEWFAARGLALAVEDESRVFPRSGRAESVRDLLSGEARRLGVTMRARAPVTEVLPVPDRKSVV
jgi:predicted flavoprotein YhiN